MHSLQALIRLYAKRPGRFVAASAPAVIATKSRQVCCFQAADAQVLCRIKQPELRLEQWFAVVASDEVGAPAGWAGAQRIVAAPQPHSHSRWAKGALGWDVSHPRLGPVTWHHVIAPSSHSYRRHFHKTGWQVERKRRSPNCSCGATKLSIPPSVLGFTPAAGQWGGAAAMRPCYHWAVTSDDLAWIRDHRSTAVSSVRSSGRDVGLTRGPRPCRSGQFGRSAFIQLRRFI